MTGWQKGRAHIEQLLSHGDLDRVQPSGDPTHRLLDEAAAHIDTAHAAIDDDPTGALQIGYDAARKAAIALLSAQGLRGTTDGDTAPSPQPPPHSSTAHSTDSSACDAEETPRVPRHRHPGSHRT